MENITTNNSILGFMGAVNMNVADKQATGQKEGSMDFLSVLRSIISGDFAGGDTAGIQNNLDIQQAGVAGSVYPALFLLMQNISNVNILKQDQLNGTGDSGFAEINASPTDTLMALLASISQVIKNKLMLKLNVDQDVSITNREEGKEGQIASEESTDRQEGAEALIQTVLVLLNNIYEARPNKESILEAIGELLDENSAAGIDEYRNTPDDIVSISDRARMKNSEKGEDIILTSPEPKQNNEIEKPMAEIPFDSITTVQFVNNFYTNAELSAAAEEKNTSTPAEEKVSPDTGFRTLNKENRQDAMPFNNVQRMPGQEANDNGEMLMKKFPDVLKQGDNIFVNDQQTGLGMRDNTSDDMKMLLTRGDKLMSDLTIKQNNDNTEPKDQDVKLLFKDSEYLSFSKNDYFGNSPAQGAQNQKGVHETAFASVMTEKIEKIVEQYSAKGASMDMIVRLRIDDRETLLVGLKNEGQRIVVDVKTTSEGIINILQTQKDVIAKNLEEKNIYTNLYIDPDGNGSFERREARRENQRNGQDAGKQKDFMEFLETSA